MIAYVHDHAVNATEGFGPEVLEQFARLSQLHADGWGSAWSDPRDRRVHVSGSESASDPRAFAGHLSPAAPARLAYLRFASRGAQPAPENIQPFLRNGLAFAHNGLLAPREKALDLLSPRERADLRGTTDSEIYFVLLQRALAGAIDMEGSDGTVRMDAETSAIEQVAGAVGELRANFTQSCLNAMLLTSRSLIVVHSAGTAPPPFSAFADRGFDLDRLPPGHDDAYNTLWTTATVAGTRLVATTGIDLAEWTALPTDSVTLITTDNIRHVALPGGS